MRVLLLSRTLPWHPGSGGLERHAWALARGFHANGHDVTIYTTWFDGPKTETREGIRIRYLVHLPENYEAKPWWRWWRGFAPRCTAVLVHDNEEGWFPDMIVSEQLHGWHTMLQNKGWVGKTVYVIHGTGWKDYKETTNTGSPLQAAYVRYQRVMDAWRARHADHIVAVSDHVAEWVSRSWWIPRGRISTIGNIVEPPTSNGVTRQGFPLYLGRLTRAKGVDRVLGIPGIRVAGDGDLRPIVEASRVPYYGLVSETDKWDLLAMAGCLVLPSESEGEPIAALEAISMGTPVVLPHRGLVPMEAEHGAVFFTDIGEGVKAALAARNGIESAARWIRRMRSGPVVAEQFDKLPTREAF